jgi:hypothetical protein
MVAETALKRSLLSLITLLCFSQMCFAESGNYRIEVLVFNHLDSTAETAEIEEIRSFSGYPELGEYMPSPAPMKIEVMSSVMQDTWRRLRLSATYRPLAFASWEQSRIDYHAPVRIHDDELIAEQVHFPYDVVLLDLQSADPFSEFMTPYFRLDGTVQLQRTRFLHINLDLEYREQLLPRPLSDPALNDHTLIETPMPEANIGDPINAEEPAILQDRELIEDALGQSPGPALVHILKQSRQVRTGQMQYFDTPYLGVLVRVTATSGL